MAECRHHRASNPAVILVLPEGGSPKNARGVKPPRYPSHQREHWTGPPKRRGKAEVLREFMRRIAENDRVARETMKPDIRLLQGWASGIAFADGGRLVE